MLLRAGELTPVEKAERRVLVLCDPGRGAGAMQVTSVIYCGLQLLLPGEVAPAHRHTPSAARIVVEGEGAYTVVEGEKCPMRPGDLILTPGGTWHDHGHEGATPVVWLDALDLPLFVYLEGSYAKERALQTPDDRPDASQVEYTAAGLLPARPRESAAPRYPLLRYPWQRTRRALQQAGASAPNGQPVELDYVNPETGGSCLPTLGFTAVMLPPDKRSRTPKRSSSAVFHVVEGEGHSTINGERFAWHAADTEELQRLVMKQWPNATIIVLPRSQWQVELIAHQGGYMANPPEPPPEMWEKAWNTMGPDEACTCPEGTMQHVMKKELFG